MTARRAFSASILILIASTIFAAPPRAKKDDRPFGTVLCYHIVEAPAAPRMHITRNVFRQHLQYLEMTGYNVIPLRQLYEYVTGVRASIPKNAVVITIDDGWRSTYTEAFPELQKRKFPFTVFIYPKIIGQTSNALTWAQIREMAEAGVDIQSHSLSHPYLTRRRHVDFGDDAYAQWLQRELTESKRLLERETGKKVEFLAYPYGDYDSKLAKFVAKAGYSAALTCDFGRVRPGSDPLRMRRFVIDDRMDFAAFRHYLGASPMQLAEVTPNPGQAVDPGVTVISAKIPNFQTLDPKSVGMALLSVASPLPYSYDSRSGSISLVLQDAISSIKARYHRAIVWGIDTRSGKRVEASWVLRLPEPPKPAAPPQAQPAAVTAPVAATSAHAAVVSAHSGGSPK
jgi:peptidoglycan/xylan/chitin deacetylase (PgdA/CDA1 family)